MSEAYAAENKGPNIMLTIFVIVDISTLFIAARLFVRIKILGQTHLDDHLTVLSLLLSYLTVGLEIWAIRCGNGRHADTLSQEQQSAAILSTISGFPPNVLAYTVPKFAVVALLVRILNPGRVHQMVLWSLATVCLVLVSLCIIILFAQCSPTYAQWDFSVTNKNCWSPSVLVNVAILTRAYSAALDLYLAIYPATVLMRLQMNMKKKIALSVALGIGSIVEGNTLIIAACIPILGPLVELALGRRVLSTTDRKYQEQSGTAELQLVSIGRKGPRSLPWNGDSVGRTSTTVIGSHHEGKDASSQESILEATLRQKKDVVGIIRREDITISYETDDGPKSLAGIDKPAKGNPF
ncbi:Integral membrane protein [Colletotrichum higginsianum IMI 349063]|uniref:Integral membrane protein n=1 Tax=Colletotrichum higginsianum (strain IMI 349063) TaxID=759273 RepID=A0A1B7YR79_COLHI|nr:Integral membrane protein [Colletotrichum higginsianum IMI 349063]OBR14454.1 Integral membrane protein [Colletotrichum higginsianum IMI 349063]